MHLDLTPSFLLRGTVVLTQLPKGPGVVGGGSHTKPGFLTPKPGALLFCLFRTLICPEELESRLRGSSLLVRTGLSVQTPKAGREDPKPLSSISSCRLKKSLSLNLQSTRMALHSFRQLHSFTVVQTQSLRHLMSEALRKFHRVKKITG